ncbi:MAG: toll/interleukin-1 receptor domain-containing protein [Chloroflexi bacterium]|nr:toll/interleukin-1 receptor domain-containing protein [Chloroflexota bacterium]
MSIPKVFISHTTHDRRDHTLARYLAEGLAERDAEVWIAPDSIPIGAEWETKIVSAIMDECSHIFVILSAASVISEWVLKEIGLAQERKDRDDAFGILPLRVGEVGDFFGSLFISKYQDVPYHDSYAAQLEEISRVLGLPDIDRAQDMDSELLERVHSFRNERIMKIKAKETPAPLIKDYCVVLHLLPINSFTGNIKYDLDQMISDDVTVFGRLAPLYDEVTNKRHNFDGFITESWNGRGPEVFGYVQLYNNGCIEVVDSGILERGASNKIPFVAGDIIEKKILHALPRYIQVQTGLKDQFPLLIAVTFVNVKNFNVWIENPIHHKLENRLGRNYQLKDLSKIDRDVLKIPEIIVNDTPNNFDLILRPIFDSIWRAGGLPRSPFYDQDGNINPNPNPNPNQTYY